MLTEKQLRKKKDHKSGNITWYRKLRTAEKMAVFLFLSKSSILSKQLQSRFPLLVLAPASPASSCSGLATAIGAGERRCKFFSTATIGRGR